MGAGSVALTVHRLAFFFSRLAATVNRCQHAMNDAESLGKDCFFFKPAAAILCSATVHSINNKRQHYHRGEPIAFRKRGRLYHSLSATP